MSAAAGAGLHGVSEVKRDSISADATRLGDSIAKQVVAASATNAANAANGWMPAVRVD